MELLKPNHGTTTLGFIFQGGVIVAVDSRASQGSYICEPNVQMTSAEPPPSPRPTLTLHLLLALLPTLNP